MDIVVQLEDGRYRCGSRTVAGILVLELDRNKVQLQQKDVYIAELEAQLTKNKSTIYLLQSATKKLKIALWMKWQF